MPSRDAGRMRDAMPRCRDARASVSFFINYLETAFPSPVTRSQIADVSEHTHTKNGFCTELSVGTVGGTGK